MKILKTDAQPYFVIISQNGLKKGIRNGAYTFWIRCIYFSSGVVAGNSFTKTFFVSLVTV